MRFVRRQRQILGIAALTAIMSLTVVPSLPAEATANSPGTPQALTSQPDDAGAYLSWSAPTSDGGAPIIGYLVTSSGGGYIYAPCGQCTSVYFAGLINGTSYTFDVSAYNGTALSASPAISAEVTPQPTAEIQASPPIHPVATVNGQSVTVTWQPPATTNGLGIDRYLVQADDVTLTDTPNAVAYAGWLYACGTCTSVTFHGLTAGDTFNFAVYAHNKEAYSPSSVTNEVVPTDPSCPQRSVCLTAYGASEQAELTHSADGFLHSVNFATTPSGTSTDYSYVGPAWNLVQALHPTSWRSDGCTSAQTVYVAECQWVKQNSPQANVTDVLSDDYYATTYNPTTGGMMPPWECWNCYSQTIKNIVAGNLNAASPSYLEHTIPPANVYWDLQNEPGIAYQYGPNQTGNTSLYLQQLLTAYNALRSADPNASVVMPSLSSFVDTSIGANDRSDTHILGFDALLPFVGANHLSVAALSWHGNSGLFDDDPSVLRYEVGELRYLEAEYGVSTTTKIFLNEYDPQFSHLIPGWSAGWIAAIESSGIAEADRACWVEGAGSSQMNECGGGGEAGNLDGLFFSPPDANGYSPNANYWVYDFYSHMAGQQVPVNTSSNSVSMLATRDNTTSSMYMLLGRHVSCTAAVNPDCNAAEAPNAYAIPTPAPTDVNLSVMYPYAATSVVATVSDIPNVRGAVAQPKPTTETLPVRNGQVRIELPSVADGDAYTIQLAPPPGWKNHLPEMGRWLPRLKTG